MSKTAKPTEPPFILPYESEHDELYLVPFFTDFGFKTAWVKSKLFPKKAIQAMLDFAEPIDKLKLIRNEILPLTVDGRKGAYDVLCQDEHKRVYIVEMQASSYAFLALRLLNYGFKQFCQLVPVGKLKVGEVFVPPLFCICIVKDKFLPGENYHNCFSLKNDAGERLYQGIEFHTFELGKFPFKIEEKNKVKSDLDKLMYTMKYAHTINPKDEKAKPDFWEEDWLKESIKELELAKMPAQKRIQIENALLDEYLFEVAHQQKIAEAKAEGKAELQKEDVLKLDARGFDLDFISDFTGLDKKQIQQIIRSHKNGKH